MGGESEKHNEEVGVTDKEKAFEYDEEFVRKLKSLEISVDFYTTKRKRLNNDKLEVEASWGFHVMIEGVQGEFAGIYVEEDIASAYLNETRDVFNILGFQAAMEVLTLITAKEKQLNEILKGKKFK